MCFVPLLFMGNLPIVKIINIYSLDMNIFFIEICELFRMWKLRRKGNWFQEAVGVTACRKEKRTWQCSDKYGVKGDAIVLIFVVFWEKLVW